jgi:hypothetical protein
MGQNTKSSSQTAINKLIHHGWHTPTVTLKTTEKQICTPAPPVCYNPPTVNVTFKSRKFSGEECQLLKIPFPSNMKLQISSTWVKMTQVRRWVRLTNLPSLFTKVCSIPLGCRLSLENLLGCRLSLARESVGKSPISRESIGMSQRETIIPEATTRYY